MNGATMTLHTLTSSLLALTLVLASACATGPEETTPPDDRRPGEEPPPFQVVPSLASNYTCATPALPDTWPSQAYRLELREENGTMWLRMERDRRHLGDDDAPDFQPELLVDDVGWMTWWEDGRLQVWVQQVELDLQQVPDQNNGLLTGSLTHQELGTFDLTCWSALFQPRFSYRGEGLCMDDLGHEGLNLHPLTFVRDTGKGNCAALGGLMLNEDDLSYPEWTGFDLRGAVFQGSSLFFAGIVDARLEGADLSGLGYGYAWVRGRTDAHTLLPQEGGCELDGTTVDCLR